MFGFWGRRLVLFFLLLIVDFLGLGLGSCLFGCFCGFGLLFALWLWGGLAVFEGFLDETDIGAYDGGVDGLVVHGLVPAYYVGVSARHFLSKKYWKPRLRMPATKRSAREMRSPTKKVWTKKVVVENAGGFEGGVEGIGDDLFVIGVSADEGAEGGREGGGDLVVGEGHPADDAGVVLLGFAKEGGLLVLGCDCSGGA